MANTVTASQMLQDILDIKLKNYLSLNVPRWSYIWFKHVKDVYKLNLISWIIGTHIEFLEKIILVLV